MFRIAVSLASARGLQTSAPQSKQDHLIRRLRKRTAVRAQVRDLSSPGQRLRPPPAHRRRGEHHHDRACGVQSAARRGVDGVRTCSTRPWRHARDRYLPRQLQMQEDAHRRRQDLHLFLAARRREERPQGRLAPAVLDARAAREPAAPRGWPHGQEGRHRGDGRLARHQGQIHRPRSASGRHAC